VKAVVVGADGFVGRHLVDHLRSQNDEVIEIAGPGSHGTATRLDIRDRDPVRSEVLTWQADAVYHLSAVSFGPDAAADVRGALAITVGGTLNLLEALAALPAPPIVLIPGSSEVYGDPRLERIHESAPLRPVNLYGATKVAQESLALAFGITRGVPVICTRSFNHIGPGQRPSFVLPAFAKQLREIASGRRAPKLHVGNLSPVRDFTDARDVVAAYRLLVEGRHTGEPVNVATGRGISVGELLDGLIGASGLDVTIEVDPARVRRHDPERLVGDPSRLEQLTSWRPRIALAVTLRDVWQDAQARFG
jgi:GDP-4-dehydro-6-deoxy-D-mannose reductase